MALNPSAASTISIYFHFSRFTSTIMGISKYPYLSSVRWYVDTYENDILGLVSSEINYQHVHEPLLNGLQSLWNPNLNQESTVLCYLVNFSCNASLLHWHLVFVFVLGWNILCKTIKRENTWIWINNLFNSSYIQKH